MQQYLNLLRHILENGNEKSDRTGTGTKAVFGHQMRFDLSEGFPIVTTKKTFMKAITAELLWFIDGSTDERRLAEIQHGKPREELVGKNTIWTANADNQGVKLGYTNTDTEKQLGPIYAHQWRSWGSGDKSYDQLAEVIHTIKNNPDSRRIILSAWNVSDIDKMALPPCHTLFQFYVNKGKLSCQLYQRSMDVFLGCPFNIASYSLMTMMIAQVCDLEPGEFIHTSGDTHIYSNHYEQCELQLTRTPYPLPIMRINPDVKNIEDFKMEDFELVNYQHHPTIKGKMAV